MAFGRKRVRRAFDDAALGGWHEVVIRRLGTLTGWVHVPEQPIEPDALALDSYVESDESPGHLQAVTVALRFQDVVSIRPLSEPTVFQDAFGNTFVPGDLRRIGDATAEDAGWRAMAYWMRGDLADAEHEASRAIEMDATLLLPWHVRGVCRFDRGAFEEALPDLDAALALDPDRVDVLGVRAACRHALGDEAGAQADRLARYRLAPELAARDV